MFSWSSRVCNGNLKFNSFWRLMVGSKVTAWTDSKCAQRTKGYFLGKTKIMSTFLFIGKVNAFLACIMEMWQLVLTDRNDICHLAKVVSGGGKQNLLHRLWGYGCIGRGPPDAIHQVTRSGGINSKTAHIGRVKICIGGRSIWALAIRSEVVRSYSGRGRDLIGI